MTHDIQDLLNLIKDLEERIIELEKSAAATAVPLQSRMALQDDSWYWDH